MFCVFVGVLSPHCAKIYLIGFSNTDLVIIMLEMIFVIFAAVGLAGMIIRRLHDMDKTGRKVLIPLILGFCTNFFVVWVIYTYYLSIKEGTDGKNKYGDKPPDED